MKLNSIQLNISNIPHSGGTRTMKVIGDQGASFTVKVIGPQGYYNFSSRTYDAGESTQSSFKGVIGTSSINIPIKFPDQTTSTGWDSYEYRVYVYPDIYKGVQISSSVGDQNIFYRTITQLEDRVVTFALRHTAADNVTFVTAKTSTGNNASNSPKTLTFDQNITNTATDAGGFGLTLTRQPVETDFVFIATDTVNGATTSSNKVVIDSLTDIGVGMIIHSLGSGGGTLVGTPTILEIDEVNKELTLSSAQTFPDGQALIFRAIGLDAIRSATGVGFTFEKLSATADEISKTVRTTASGNNIDLNGTYGISKGATISGVNIVNTSANAVQTVSASSSAGYIEMQVSQTVKAGSKIYIHGCTDTIRLKGNLIIDQYPTKNISIYLATSGFITAGAGS